MLHDLDSFMAGGNMQSIGEILVDGDVLSVLDFEYLGDSFVLGSIFIFDGITNLSTNLVGTLVRIILILFFSWESRRLDILVVFRVLLFHF